MRISETITVRGGQVFEIKGINANGTQVLRPVSNNQVAVDRLLDEVFAHVRSQLDKRVPAPAAVKEPAVVKTQAPVRQVVSKKEPATITYARSEEVSISTRVGSQWGYGLRSHSVHQHSWNTKREIKAMANHWNGCKRAESRHIKDGFIGKHASWKDSRDTQYR